MILSQKNWNAVLSKRTQQKVHRVERVTMVVRIPCSENSAYWPFPEFRAGSKEEKAKPSRNAALAGNSTPRRKLY